MHALHVLAAYDQVVEKISTLAMAAITTSIKSTMETVKPQIDSLGNEVKKVTSGLDQIISKTDTKAKELEARVAKTISDGAADAKKAQDGFAASQKKIVDKLASSQGVIPFSDELDKKKCDGNTIGATRFYKKKNLQVCDGIKWSALGGSEATGDVYAPFGSKAAPWGTTCADILKKRKDLGEKPTDGVVSASPLVTDWHACFRMSTPL